MSTPSASSKLTDTVPSADKESMSLLYEQRWAVLQQEKAEAAKNAAAAKKAAEADARDAACVKNMWTRPFENDIASQSKCSTANDQVDVDEWNKWYKYKVEEESFERIIRAYTWVFCQHEAPHDVSYLIVRWLVADFNDDLVRGIVAFGWQKPIVVQQRAILPMVRGRDIIVQAQSGRGKTGALAIACLQRVDLHNPKTQIIIISPSRDATRAMYDLLRASPAASRA